MCFWRATFVVLLTLSSAATASAQTWQSGLAVSYSSGGYSMPYRVYLPANYSSSHAYPLVLFLHGSGERGSDDQAQVNTHIDGLINETYGNYPAILVAPQLPAGNTYWYSGNSYDLTLGILGQVEQNYSVNTNRLYLTGLSLGGFGTTQYAGDFPAMFAAIVPMSGANSIPPSAGQPISRVPTWLFQGSSDTTVSPDYARNYFLNVTGNSSINFNASYYGYPTAVSGSTRYTELPGWGHDIWEQIYGNSDTAMYDWMFAQHLPLASAGSVIIKANNTTSLNQGGSWNGGTVPGASDTMLWDSTLAGPSTVALGGSLSVGMIQVRGPGGAVTISNDGNTLTLGAPNGTGIDLSAPRKT